MSIPTGDLPLAPRVLELARGAALTPVWQNNLGGVTFRATDADGVRFIKYGLIDPESTRADEAARLRWAAPYLRVPEVITVGTDGTYEWLETYGLPGRSAVEPYWINRPAQAVRAVGAALRVLHDSLPVAECPYTWSVADRIAGAADRGVIVPDDLHTPPPFDQLVVCHADACVPNTLLLDDGTLSAHVDLGALGVADRWADLAVATWSTQWNYGPGYDDALLEGYGIAADPERIAYYRALWDAT